MDSIEYYNQHATEYFQNTVDIDMKDNWDAFTTLLPEGASVLDLGCGSGRDSAYFLTCGFDVTSLDASYEMCDLASVHIGHDVLHLAYEDMDFDQVFDGVWACASLVHIPSNQIDSILVKIINGLKVNGILYMSFHYGDFEGVREGRYFTDYGTKKLKELILRHENTEIIDIQKCREHSWIYAIIKKI